jgi:hypothetical protein
VAQREPENRQNACPDAGYNFLPPGATPEFHKTFMIENVEKNYEI